MTIVSVDVRDHQLPIGAFAPHFDVTIFEDGQLQLPHQLHACVRLTDDVDKPCELPASPIGRLQDRRAGRIGEPTINFGGNIRPEGDRDWYASTFDLSIENGELPGQ